MRRGCEWKGSLNDVPYCSDDRLKQPLQEHALDRLQREWSRKETDSNACLKKKKYWSECQEEDLYLTLVQTNWRHQREWQWNEYKPQPSHHGQGQ